MSPKLPVCAFSRTQTHTLTSFLCFDGTAKKTKVSKYIKLLCLLGLLRVNSLQLCPASALEVAPLSVRAPADPYQSLLLFNSLHIHDTSTYSSCKMQMPLSFSSQRKAVCTSEIFVLFLYCHPTAGHVDFILLMNPPFLIILIISSDNHSEDVRWISHHVLFQKSWLLRKASSPNINKKKLQFFLWQQFWSLSHSF